VDEKVLQRGRLLQDARNASSDDIRIQRGYIQIEPCHNRRSQFQAQIKRHVLIIHWHRHLVDIPLLHAEARGGASFCLGNVDELIKVADGVIRNSLRTLHLQDKGGSCGCQLWRCEKAKDPLNFGVPPLFFLCGGMEYNSHRIVQCVICTIYS
jgi:hypothetical protein